jgi:dihydrofolate reductase
LAVVEMMEERKGGLMRTVFFGMHVSLDGYIEGPNGDLSWTAPDLELHQYFNDLERRVDLSLYGRRLYENMANYWPAAAQDPSAAPVEVDYAKIWCAQPRIVFSTTLQEAAWAERIVRENVAEEVHRLKEQPGGLISVGGAGLAASLSQMGLIDEYWLYIHPVLLGSGKPMFGPLTEKIDLELVETQRIGERVLMLRYKKV